MSNEGSLSSMRSLFPLLLGPFSLSLIWRFRQKCFSPAVMIDTDCSTYSGTVSSFSRVLFWIYPAPIHMVKAANLRLRLPLLITIAYSFHGRFHNLKISPSTSSGNTTERHPHDLVVIQ